MKKGCLCLSVLFLLTGCWDQKLLNQTKLITAGSIDLTKNEKILSTVSVPQAAPSEAGLGSITNQIFQGTGHTARESRLNLDEKISERLEASKTQIIVFGEKIAKKDIYQYLDVFYRDPTSPLNAKIAVAKGKGSDIISAKFIEPKSSIGIGVYLRDTIRSAEQAATIPKENIQSICPIMLDPGQDFALPYLESKKETVKVNGVALFHKHHLVGTIKAPQSVMYTLLTGESSTIAMSSTYKITDTHKKKVYNYVTIKVKKNNRKFKVTVSPEGKIFANIHLKIKVFVTEYPGDNLDKKTKLMELEKLLTKKLTADSQQVIDKLQKMNSDPYGVGRNLIAFHYPTWKKLNWTKEYPKIDFKATVGVDIIGHGIIE